MTAINDTSPLLAHYVRLADGFATVLDAAPAGTWTADSPCEGWTGRDVVGHVIDTQREFFSRHDIDAGPAPSLDDPAAAWHTHRDTVAGLLADPTVGQRTFDGHFGPTTIGDTLIRFYGFDMVAHRWDIARAAGADHRFSDDDLSEMEAAVDGFGDAIYSEGVCRKVEIPAGADRQTTLLARLGRVAS